MSDTELDRVASALGRLLRTDDANGSSDGGPRRLTLDEAAARIGEQLDIDVTPDLVRQAATRGKRFEVHRDEVRLRRGRPNGPGSSPPDILYHACTEEQVRTYLAEGIVRVQGGARPVFLSDDETQAWRAAHRMASEGSRGGATEPRVLYVDTARQRRRKLPLQRNRRGLWFARQIGLPDVLNLRPDFAEQLSAGGIPVVLGPDGQPRMALIRVTRRSGVTWEVAKGKLEPGEPPEWAGVREVQEEMGIPQVDFDVKQLVGLVRYGFLAPGGLPRLKTVFLYLLQPRGTMDGRFSPSEREGIKDVRWFTLDEACDVVTHSSLRPLMRRARRLAADLDLRAAG
ncbi:MAG: NUDIX domain-containing protein [Myxococcales bacterium]|nr:NUDIX domain-containing protein [Myxococcales bacterium]